MTPDKFDWHGWLDEDMHFATNMLLDSGSVTPMFVLHTRSGELKLIGTHFHSDAAKQMSYRTIRLMCIVHDVVGFSCIGEAWIRMLNRRAGESDREMLDRGLSVLPAKAADRKEVVTVTLVYRDEIANERKVIGKMVEIVRGADGKPNSVIPIALPVEKNVEGELPEILPAKTPSAQTRAAATTHMLNMVPFLRDLQVIVPDRSL